LKKSNLPTTPLPAKHMTFHATGRAVAAERTTSLEAWLKGQLSSSLALGNPAVLELIGFDEAKTARSKAESAATGMGKATRGEDERGVRPRATPTSIQPTASPQRPRLSFPSAWVCSTCTLQNAEGALACIACGASLPSDAASRGRTAAASGNERDAPASSTSEMGPVEMGRANLERMADDNSCLFHAIAFLLRPDATPEALRALVVETVTADPERWNEATLGKPMSEYIAFISDARRWGGQVELAIFSERFRAEICVTDIQSGRADAYGTGAGYSSRVYMLFSGVHFDAVSIGGQRIFGLAETASADVLVGRLAAEVRAKGGFTDQATMVLRCTLCGHIMVGDLEARQHAGSSGHRDFVMHRE